MNITEKLSNKKYYVRSVKEYKTIIKKLNKNYPDFLKVVDKKKQSNKVKQKNVLKHILWKDLEELAQCMMK
jgi:hypothetical protein